MGHVATINAFANEFGTFTGAVYDRHTKETLRQRFDTYDEARNFVRSKAWDLYGPVRYAAIRRKNEYLANVWKA